MSHAAGYIVCMSRILVVALFVVLVAAMTALFLWPKDEDRAPQHERAEAGSHPELPEPSKDAVEGGQLAPGRLPIAADTGSGAIDGTDAQASAVVPTLSIQVWNREQGVAAPNADVFVLDEVSTRGLDREAVKGSIGDHWSGLAERLGRRVRTDEHGQGLVRSVRGVVIVVAKLDGAFACEWLEDNRGELRHVNLTLQSDESITVRVVDDQKRPVAGVAVGIIQRIADIHGANAGMKELERMVQATEAWIEANPKRADAASAKLLMFRDERAALRSRLETARLQSEQVSGDLAGQPPMRVEVRARRRTNAQGLAVFEHFQLHRGQVEAAKSLGKRKPVGKSGKRMSKDGRKALAQNRGVPSAQQRESSPEFEAALLIPLQRPVTKAFSGAPVPEGVVELRMPPTGSVSLRTVDRDGRPFTHPVHGELRMRGGDTALEQAFEWTQVALHKKQNEQAIEFAHVGLGLHLDARCRLSNARFRWDAPAFEGPVEAGEHRSYDLIVAPHLGMLHGRLVDPAGKALAGIAPTFVISSAAGSVEDAQVVADEQGSFHLPYQMLDEDLPPYRLEVRRDDVTPIAGFATQLAALPQAMVTDLGNLALDAFGAIVAGVVVDDLGQPIADATVQLQRERGLPMLSTEAKNAVEAERGPRFVDEAHLRTQTDREGRFALFGSLDAGSYRLRAETKVHFPGVALFSTGDDACSVQLTRESRIFGNVSMPEWMTRDRVQVELRPVHVPGATEAGDVKVRTQRLANFDDRTHVYFGWVRPGTYDLVFRLQGFPDPFLRFDQLVVEPGQVGVHPRLAGLDLGASIYRFEIHPVDQSGQPVDVNRPQLAKLTRGNGEAMFVGLVMKGSFGEVFSTTPKLEVLPMCEGYVAERQVLAAGRSELLFRAVPPVEVVLPGLHAMAGSVPVRVVLERLNRHDLPEQLDTFDGMSERIADWYTRVRYSSAMLTALDVASIRVTAPGPHRVSLRLGSSKAKPTTVELEPVELTVEPGGNAQRCVVDFDPEIVRAAIVEAARQN